MESMKRGLLAMTYAPRVRINPPLVITTEQALEAVSILDEVLGELMKTSLWKNS